MEMHSQYFYEWGNEHNKTVWVLVWLKEYVCCHGAGGAGGGETSQECQADQRSEVVKRDLVYSSSSSSSSSSSAGGASPPSSSSGVSGSPAFLPGRSPNHLGRRVLALLLQSSYLSFHMASSISARTTSQPPSYSFFLSP